MSEKIRNFFLWLFGVRKPIKNTLTDEQLIAIVSDKCYYPPLINYNTDRGKPLKEYKSHLKRRADTYKYAPDIVWIPATEDSYIGNSSRDNNDFDFGGGSFGGGGALSDYSDNSND